MADSKCLVALTPNVHNALLALGRGKALTDNVAYSCAAESMLLGILQKVDLETLLAKPKILDEFLRKIRALPHSSHVMNRANIVCQEATGGVLTGANYTSYYYQFLANDIKDRLGRNVEGFDWCNSLWTKLLETDATQADVVMLFVNIIMAGTRCRLPVQEFPSQWSALGNTRTLDELQVMGLSATIRNKPDWRRKLEDEGIISKWREEAYAQDVTQSMFDYMLAELQWLAGQLDGETGIDHATVPGIFFSDILISINDRDMLRSGVNVLSAKEKDWHPGSNEQVLDLVHPSLYPYVRGRTPRFLQEEAESPQTTETSLNNTDAVATSILNFLHPPPPQNRISSPVASLTISGSGIATSMDIPSPDIVERKWGESSNYQWLPVDVEVSPGPIHSARFLSYINNLHPTSTTEAPLYPIVERIFARFIPLFERTLTQTRLRRTGDAGVRTEFLNGPTDDHQSYYNIPEPDEDESGSDEEDDFDERLEYYRENREFLRPVVAPFVQPGPPGPAQVTLGGKTLQVIIKMANVHLTPEKPSYAGGSWHVEGTNNERIVATGIYYFESENINDAPLEFRQAVEDPRYEQSEFQHLQDLYGIVSETWGGSTHANQHLGAIVTPEGRCICFPNGIQHRLMPFNLLDVTKPGHRKILVFFLVDPSTRILSTSDVPPQQLEWFFRELRMQVGTRLSSLPPELFNLICEHVRAVTLEAADSSDRSSKWLMSLAEAQEHRLQLMRERAAFVDKVNEDLYERTYSLCEH